MRAFARAPTPARYLAATRALRTAQRRHKLSLLSRAGGERRIEQGLDILSRGADLAPELLEALRALPPTPATGAAWRSSPTFLTAHRLILACASGGYLELLQSLGPMRRGAGRRRR